MDVLSGIELACLAAIVLLCATYTLKCLVHTLCAAMHNAEQAKQRERESDKTVARVRAWSSGTMPGTGIDEGPLNTDDV
jgi:hypothetical protein